MDFLFKRTAGRGGGITGPTPPPQMPQVMPPTHSTVSTPQGHSPAPSVPSQSEVAPTQGSSNPPSSQLSKMSLDRPPTVHKIGTAGKQ